MRKFTTIPRLSISATYKPVHQWDLLAYSVRCSSKWDTETHTQKSRGLRTAYTKAYDPEYLHTANVPGPARGKSSRRPLNITPFQEQETYTQLFSEELLDKWKDKTILVLFLSMEGLTTNLQGLVEFALDSVSSNITLDFTTPFNPHVQIYGQENRGKLGWLFYDIQVLSNNITGKANNEYYMRLIKALFVLQKHKQSYVILSQGLALSLTGMQAMP